MKAYRAKKTAQNSNLKLMSVASFSVLLAGCSFDLELDKPTDYFGTDGDDVMNGTKNVLVETFHSSLGADRMTSKSPAVVDYSKSNAGVTVYLDGTVGKGGHAEGDVLIGINSVIGSDFDDVITGGGGVQYGISGGAGNDILYGTADYDKLLGDEGDDKLYGYDGADYLTGGSGADVLDGGAGSDWVIYEDSTAGVTVNLLTGAASGGDAQGDTFIAIENVNGSGFDDHLTGDDASNTLNGYAGNDQIFGLGGNDRLNGGTGDDQISGGDGDDVIFGGQGDDILNGGAGDDGFYSTFGLQGTNIVNGGSGTDLVSESESGADLVYVIEKTDGKINFTYGDNVHLLNSIENIRLLEKSGSDILVAFDVKDIWSELALAEQAKFADEADFLSWLGNDAGYNYEGL